MAQEKVPLSRIENGETLKEMLAWFCKMKQTKRAKPFKELWRETRRRAEKAGYGPDDVDRLIQEVRRAGAHS